MLRQLARLTAVVCALWASQAFALGLGDINVRSKLNQPFSASIPVLDVSSGQIDGISVRLASADDFNRSGIERSDYLLTLKFEVAAGANGPHVVVSSDQIAREPFLNFVVEARGPAGKLLREYTVLLDPPAAVQAAAPVAAPATTSAAAADSSAPAYTPPPAYAPPVASSSPAPAPAGDVAAETPPPAAAPAPRPGKMIHGKPAHPPKAAPAPLAAAPEPAPAAAAPEPTPESAPAAIAGGTTYGPVGPQETFWSIANKLRPNTEVSINQIILAVYRQNPEAFDHGSFNGLRKGVVLQVPSAEQMAATPLLQAKAEVDAWRRGTPPGALKKPPEAPAALSEAAPPAAAAPKAPKQKPAKIKKSEAALPSLIEPAPVSPAAAPVTAAPATAPAPSAPAPAPAATPSTAAPSTPAPSNSPPPAAAPAAAEPAKADTAAAAPATSPAAAAPPADSTPPPPPPKKILAPPPPPGLFEDPMAQYGAIAVAVLLIGLFGWFIFRRRNLPMPDFRAKAPAATPPKVKPAPAPKNAIAAAPVPPPLPPAKPAPAKLGDTTALPDEPIVKPVLAPAPVVAPAPKVEPEEESILSRTSLDDTAKMKMADTGLSSSLFDQTAQSKAAPVGDGDLDFDLTSQFEAQTMSINLDANDPLSEADFHLAYGLYDEAASLLKQALAKDPQRQELRQKLAETYFAGGKPLEFQETAEVLHGQVSQSDWQKIAIMGRQLCPDAALFKADTAAPAPDIDLSLGDSIGPAPLQVIGSAAPAAAATPPPAAAPAAAPKPAARKDPNVIDFDFDSEIGKVEPTVVAPTAAPQEKADFDLSHFDFDAAPAPAGGEGSIEFNLDDLDLSKPGGTMSGDEIGTKLDLARVYADMGDNEAARGLLDEVLATGNTTQKGEAEALIKRLSA